MKKLKRLITAVVGTGLMCAAGVSLADHLVSKQIYHPNPRTKIVTEKVCGPRGCVHIQKKIRNRQNGTQKIVTERCSHGYCRTHIVVRR